MTFERVKIGLYALAAASAAALLAALGLLKRPEISFGVALLAATPPSIALGAIGLAARYPCRAMPLRQTAPSRVIGTHLVSALAAASLWVLIWNASPDVIMGDVKLLFGVGVVLYLASVTVHYLTLEVEASREAEAVAMRYQVLAREAELRAFKAQIDPHFLYNSLNSIAALCGSRPQDAREMAQLMADFFRLTLRVGSRDRITLSEEVDLINRYLNIERVRFGSRLATRIEIDENAAGWLVPPLLLQPLVENSVRHGIASVVEGGTIEIRAGVLDEVLHISVENPADPDRPQPGGESIGLRNATGRLASVSNGRASLRTEELDGRFTVTIELPA